MVSDNTDHNRIPPIGSCECATFNESFFFGKSHFFPNLIRMWRIVCGGLHNGQENIRSNNRKNDETMSINCTASLGKNIFLLGI